MTTTYPYIVREDEAKKFYEGAELCRVFFRNEDLWFGTSLVNPGDTGAVDPGHVGAWEAFYCVSGEGFIDDGENEYLLRAGDALAVPPLSRTGFTTEAPSQFSWSGLAARTRLRDRIRSSQISLERDQVL